MTKKDMILNNYLPKLTGVLGCFFFNNMMLLREYYIYGCMEILNFSYKRLCNVPISIL